MSQTTIIHTLDPIDGGLSITASIVSPCSVTCGVGIEIVQHECNNPAPAHGGFPCDIADLQEVQRVCTQAPCPGEYYKIATAF